ncbi:hypothetical protein B0H13DRAFT_2345401 [Mycena leptocephala]|nr:hypothetical protein B0H13DRAFT_2345401 [Mycena leptocephala]
MPGTRRTRTHALLWTHHKSKSSYHNRQFEAPSASPTGSNWEALEQLGSFIIGKETDKEETSYLKNQCSATVVPPGTRLKSKNILLEVEQLWITKIKEIRVNIDGQTKVNWYYSPSNVKEHMPSFDVSRCAKYEHIYSHHSEVISALTLYRPLPMVDFLEDDPDQVQYELDVNLDYWEQDIDFNGWEDTIVERNLSLEDDNTGAEVHICPVCEGAI